MKHFLSILSLLTTLSSCKDQHTSKVSVIGGRPLTSELYKANFQSIASLQHGVIHCCGATLISANEVLTAAHCVVDYNQEEARQSLSLLFGITDLSDDDNPERERIAIESFRVHPQYDPETYQNDFALISLKESPFIKL